MIKLPNLAHKNFFKDLNKGLLRCGIQVIASSANLVTKPEEDMTESQHTKKCCHIALWFIIKIIPDLIIKHYISLRGSTA